MDETDDRQGWMDRRTVLQRTGAGAFLGLGVLQDDDEQGDDEQGDDEQGDDEQGDDGQGGGEAQLRRRFLLRRVARFERDDPADDYVGRGLLVTTKANVEGEPRGEFDCEFPDWDPEGFVKYQVLLFDVNQGIITESRAYIAEGSDPIPTGTPYLINVGVPCSGRYVGIEGERIPGRLVE